MQMTMLRGMAIGASAVLGLALFAPSAGAQGQTSGARFGVAGSLHSSDGETTFAAGAFGKYHLADISGHAITGRVAFDYFFPDNGTWWDLSADGLLDIANEGSDLKPYVGAGATYEHYSFESFSDNNTNLHFVGGINFMGNSTLMPFGEAKLVMASNDNYFLFKVGIHIK